MAYVAPLSLEDKHLLAATLGDVIDALEWFQSNLPDPLIDAQLSSLRWVRDRLGSDAFSR